MICYNKSCDFRSANLDETPSGLFDCDNAKNCKKFREKELCKQTNRQWLDKLSDEELAKFLMCKPCGNHCNQVEICGQPHSCSKGFLSWLKAEHGIDRIYEKKA